MALRVVVLLLGAILTRIGLSSGAACFYADDICPNGNISFWLRTRNTDKGGFKITEDNLANAPLKNGSPLIVLIHGYTGHKDYSPNPELVSAYLKHGDYNIISVDWGKLALKDCYLTSAYNVPVAGKCTARLLRQIYAKKGEQWKKATHVVGFSLGAHVAGVLGNQMPGLPRITGLDPALPLFSTNSARAESRLDSSDANFVDIYHTNAGWKGRLGSLGHVDFYLNNGASQPGCHSNSSCDHHRAVIMFGESINSPVGFYGRPCSIGVLSYLSGISKELCTYTKKGNVLVKAGEHINPKVQGTYKIETNYDHPLAKGLPLPDHPGQIFTII